MSDNVHERDRDGTSSDDLGPPDVLLAASGSSSPHWQKDRPEIDLGLKIAPGQVATFEMVRTDESGTQETLRDFQGYIMASDLEPWEGSLQIGSVRKPHSGAERPMITRIAGDEGATTTITETLRGFWVFDVRGPSSQHA